MGWLIRAFACSWFIAASLLLWSGKARAQEEPAPQTVVQCQVSPCAVEISAKLDATEAIGQLQAAIVASIEDPTSVGVTTEGMVKVFGGMFGLVWFFWGLGYGVGLVVNLIRKV